MRRKDVENVKEDEILGGVNGTRYKDIRNIYK